MTMTRKILAFLMAAVLLFAAGGCADLANVLEENTDLGEETPSPSVLPSASPEPVYGGSISLALYGFDTADPILTQSESYKNLVPLVYDSLITVKQNLTVSMCLAERYERSEDGKKYTLYLKPGVTFHDGSEFSAKDVAYTVRYIRSSESSPYAAQLSNVAKSYAEDGAYVFELTAPDFGFLNDLDFPILKENSAANRETFPIGTGKYKVERTESTGNIILRANAAWHGGKQPYLDEMIWVRLPDRETAAYALDTREISALGSYAVDYISYSPKANLSAVSVYTGNLCFLGFNHQNVYLSKQLIRWCIEASIDKEKLVQEVLLGKGAVVNLPYYADAFYHDSALKESRLDTDKADNILEMGLLPAETETSVFRILVSNTDPVKVELARAIAAMLQERGINATVDRRSYEAYRREITYGNYDLFIGEVKLDKGGDLAALLGEGNPFFYQSEDMNAALAGAAASADEAEAIENYAKVSELFLKECPFVPLFLRQEALIYDSRIAGEKEVTAFDFYAGIENWYFD